jgi:hypothetical protein
VLIAVMVYEDTNCVFLHLLENPGLCVRRSASNVARNSPESIRGPRSPANRNGKQEQD